MKRVVGIASLVFALGLAAAAGLLRLPYYAVGPGPAREVQPLITFSGHPRYESQGKLIMTTVRWYQVTPLQALRVWFDPHWTLVRQDVLYPKGTNQAIEVRQARSEMDQSKIDAASVALHAILDYPKEHGTGALIESVIQGCPAEGKLVAGEVITAIDGKPVTSREQASKAIDAVAPGDPVGLSVMNANATTDVQLTRAVCGGSSRPLVGITMVQPFPFSISISSGDIGGPSAGLMWALGLYDLMTPGDLTGGRIVAGTGTIDTKGHVGPIGGITDKVSAAESVGAQVFLVPAENMAELKGVDTGSMKLVSVSTFQDALDALGALSP